MPAPPETKPARPLSAQERQRPRWLPAEEDLSIPSIVATVSDYRNRQVDFSESAEDQQNHGQQNHFLE